jgi:hypothetical protein
MKVIAIATKTAAWTPEQFEKLIPHEAPHTLQLYLDGKVEQFWFREKMGPIFLMNVESLDDARAAEYAAVRLGGLHTYELMSVAPLAPLGPPHPRQVTFDPRKRNRTAGTDRLRPSEFSCLRNSSRHRS